MTPPLDPGGERLARLLRAAMPPHLDGTLEPDLWPQMLRRLEQSPAPAFGWPEWLLAAAIALVCVLHPDSVALLLYHL